MRQIHDIVISGFFIYLFILDYVTHSGHAPAMTISDPSMISKRENLAGQNSRVFKYLFSPL